MAEPTTGVRFGGTLRDGSGSLIASGVTANTFAVNTTTPAIGTEDTSFTTGQFDIADAGFGRFDLKLLNGTDQIWWSSRAEVQLTSLQARNPTTVNAALEVFSTTNEASTLVGVFGGRRSTEASGVEASTSGGTPYPSDNDEAYLNFELANDNATPQQWIAGKFTWVGLDVSDGSEDGRLEWDVMQGGSLATEMTLDGSVLTLNGGLTVAGTTTLNGNLVLGDAAADTLALNATITGGTPLVFEGANTGGDNAHETSFAITDPTADRTITFPDTTLTVNAAADISGTTLASNVVTTSATTVGALNAGSITSGFTSIDVGAGAITTTGALSIASMGTNWTNAGRTVADAGILTTVDINGGTIDGAVIGGAATAAITGTAVTGTSIVGGTVAGTSGTFSTDLSVDGIANLDNTDIDGTLVVDGSNISLDSTATLNIDNSNTSNGIAIGTATSGVPVTIGHGTSDVTIGDDLIVTGDLTVSGTTTTVTSTTVAIADSLLLLAKDQGTSADAVDFGLYGKYGVGGTAKYAGIFRDGSVTGDPWTFFDGNQAEPGTTVNTGGTGYDLADISAGAITSADGFSGDLTGNVTGNASGTAATVTGGTQASITTVANVVEVGALNAGSITSNFGTINNGASAITTTGAVGTGALTVADGSGLIVGHSAALTDIGDGTPANQILGTTAADSSLALIAHGTTDAVGPYLVLGKSGHADLGGETAVVDDELLGAIRWVGMDADSGDMIPRAAEIKAFVDGDPGANDMPGRLVFYTTADGNPYTTERLRIDSAGLSTFAGNVQLGGGDVDTANAYSALVIEKDDYSRLEFLNPTDKGGTIWFSDTTEGMGRIEYHHGTANHMAFATNATQHMLLDSTGTLFIGDTANTGMTQGLTINQGANYDEWLALKTTLTGGGHGLTTGTNQRDIEVDDVYVISTLGAANGGYAITATGRTGLNIVGIEEYYNGGTVATTDTSSSLGVVSYFVAEHNGSNAITDMAANSNAFAWGEISSGAARLTRMLLKADDGELQLGNTTLVALDSEDDRQIVRAMQRESSNGGIIVTDRDNPFYDYDKLHALGLAGEKDADDFFLFPLQSRLHAHEGAMWQNYLDINDSQDRIIELENRLEATEQRLLAAGA